MRSFGHPRGLLGRLGGMLMARMNRSCAVWVAQLLELQPSDRVLEVGFGPGVAIQLMASAVSEGSIAGVDSSDEMIAQARARNLSAIQGGRVDLRLASAESLPFAQDTFDKVFAINSMHLWADAIAGLREMRRVTKVGGQVALAFTPYSGYTKIGLTDKLTIAGFTVPQLMESDQGFCAMAAKA